MVEAIWKRERPDHEVVLGALLEAAAQDDGFGGLGGSALLLLAVAAGVPGDGSLDCRCFEGMTLA